MKKIKIGIVKEGKIPIDRRVPITPHQAQHIKESFHDVELVCQSSAIRCHNDVEYEQHGIKVVEEVDDCDVLLGVKEVQIKDLIEGKTYFFFSHTIKKQEYNRDLLRAILDKKIRLIDYECLTDVQGKRLIAFGRYAGIVGAYNGIYTYGKRYNLFDLRRAKDCFDLEDLKNEFAKVELPRVKIILTGGGRVAKGAMEVLNGMGIRKVAPSLFLNKDFDEAVYTQLNSRDYHNHKKGKEFSRNEFYANPENYEIDFHKYAEAADILIAGAFWDPSAPVLFTAHDVLQNDFNIKVIADITCDIEGSIPSTKQPSTIEDPIYDYNPSENKVEAPFTDEANISVMAVDNLPCELPRNASEDFGKELVNHVLPNLIYEDEEDVIKRATIAENGKLTERYNYLQDYVDGK
ncbi:NAD(P)-dependent oxidoreductase [Fulvivirgaceae bacterium BMA10]|uniref:Saccharopine dehydrogenase [NAD(+), L-lysine-forming] n=1 Tax=Splendidivirga corallicola TaxID=3051826 RepID=A0ABT8KTH4_9BACT|nr:NAD(P)-dependent oxidoreductase [Fulvivirgaceae bacterium BMA10]